VGLDENTVQSLERYALFGNNPNSFFGNADIEYSIPKGGYVSLRIYNLSGQLIRDLIDKKQKSGYYKVHFDGKDNKGEVLKSGVYFYKMDILNYSCTKRMIFLH